ncbi:MAG TPA: sigma-70 family RNA polymerase sigma factor [Verrucomicrobiae bacterium]|nr:sigma-70 family RNA polymerase sigma factor [Verrucomicrobiae bacterium]
MNEQTDQELLREYAERKTESAFAELVRRHVDFVYSAALRMVRDEQLAEDVTQSVLVACAKNARQLAGHPVLSGWLHRTAQNLAANTVRTEVRRRNREQEALAMNELMADETSASWENISPLLDDALGELNDPDRDALWLHFFQRKSAREMAQALGISDAAAQKRVSRAMERLREIFVKRGVAVGAGSLATVLAANGVQAAPIGLAATITASLAATTAVTSATATTIKTIAMTTLQKISITAALAVTVGAGVYQTHRVASLQQQVQALAEQQAQSEDASQQLARERDAAKAELGSLRDENARLSQSRTEVLKLRGELTRLGSGALGSNADTSDPLEQLAQNWTVRAEQLNQYLQQMPDKKIPELEFLTTDDWLNAAKKADFDTEADIRRSLRELRRVAKNNLPLGRALWSYIHDNDGQLPTDISQLKKYFQAPVTDSSVSDWKGVNSPADEANLDAILNRYQLLQTGKYADLPAGTWLATEKAPVDKDYDTRIKFGAGTSSVVATGIGEAGDPDDKNY